MGWAGSWLGSWLEIQEQSLASRECSGRLGLAREKSTNARSWSGKLLEPEWDTPELVRQSGANPQKKVLGIDRVSDPTAALILRLFFSVMQAASLALEAG